MSGVGSDFCQQGLLPGDILTTANPAPASPAAFAAPTAAFKATGSVEKRISATILIFFVVSSLAVVLPGMDSVH
jgi:hypothetical protein